MCVSGDRIKAPDGFSSAPSGEFNRGPWCFSWESCNGSEPDNSSEVGPEIKSKAELSQIF